MIKSASSLKGKIKHLANKDVHKAEAYMRIFFMERLLERISVSKYKEKFILKGGMLAASLIGVDLRTTMDMDTTVKGLPLNEADIKSCIEEIASINLDDGVSFRFISTETIMDDFDYPGVRIHIEGAYEIIRQRLKIDISTDDVITPGAIQYKYKLIFEDRYIDILTYNTETLLAEKMQTILSRSIANTRLRDYYDVYMVSKTVSYSVNLLVEAFAATCQKRGKVYSRTEAEEILNLIRSDKDMSLRWDGLKENYFFIEPLEWKEVFEVLENLILQMIK